MSGYFQYLLLAKKVNTGSIALAVLEQFGLKKILPKKSLKFYGLHTPF